MSFFMEFHAKAADVPLLMSQFANVPAPVKDYVSAAIQNLQDDKLIHVKAQGHLGDNARGPENHAATIDVWQFAIAAPAPPK